MEAGNCTDVFNTETGLEILYIIRVYLRELFLLLVSNLYICILILVLINYPPTYSIITAVYLSYHICILL